MYTLRFNLGRGENFKKWKLTNKKTNKSVYLDPNNYSIELENCQLKNNRATANKIHEGKNKTVCAWIVADNFKIVDPKGVRVYEDDAVSYNPRIKPFWSIKGKDSDNLKIDKLVTLGNKVFA